MSLKTIVPACLVLVSTGCLAAAPAGGTPLSTCQRIVEPGQYYLTTGLDGAPIEVSTEAELEPSYTGSSSLEWACIEIASSGVALDCQGNTLTGAGQESKATVGIYIAGSTDAPLSDVSVENCVITGHQYGLYAGYLLDSAISNSEARRNKSIGFYLTNLSSVSITSNIAEGNDPDGILLIGSQDVTVSDNVAFYNRMRGITFEGCQGCEASRNESYSHGVLGFAIYGSRNMTLEKNIAHDNRYHGFAILHEAGSTTFLGNESYENDGSGFYLEGSRDNHYLDNMSHDNALDGITLFEDSQANTFEGNTLRDNDGYGVFSSAAIDSAAFSGNTLSGNGLAPTGSSDAEPIDLCKYTGFGEEGPCDPVFEGGPNLKDPTVLAVATEPASTPSGRVILSAQVVGDRISIPRMGDLWMNTWADDDALYFGWGDGTGMTNCWPSQYGNLEGFGEVPPVLEVSPGLYEINPICSEYLCGFDLICSQIDCLSSVLPLCPVTDFGLFRLTGPVPDFDPCGVGDCVISRHIPSDLPAYRVVEVKNDKPSSLLFVDGRLYAATHDFAGEPTYGYIAYSDDYGASWTEVTDSPWGSDSNFRVLMFINMGQAYELNSDGFVYTLGVPAEALWGTQMAVYLTRVPIKDVASYSAYEYFVGLDSANQPGWSSNQSEAKPVPGLNTHEQGSAIYHEGTGRYLFLTTKTGDFTDVFVGGLFEAPAPWGPWIQVAVLFGPENTPAWNDGGYIPGLISKGTGDDSVYFTMSGGDNHYHLSIGRIEFELARDAQ